MGNEKWKGRNILNKNEMKKEKILKRRWLLLKMGKEDPKYG